MIIDGHAHISDTDYGNVELYVQALDEAGVEKGVVVPGGMMDVREMTLYIMGEKESEEEIPNNVVYNAIKKYPERLKGYVCINPLEEDSAFATFEEGIKNGCVGVKLNPMSHKFAFSGEVLDVIAEECGKQNLPIYTHTLFNPGASTEKLGVFSQRHPETNFILGHMGFGPADVLAREFARDYPNFYLETSLGNYLNLTIAVEKVGPDKLIFGSEFPMSTPDIELFQIRKLSPQVHDRICFENLKKLIPSLN